MANVSRNIIKVSQDTLRCPLDIIETLGNWKQDPNTCQHASKALLVPPGHDKNEEAHYT
jgi:hypothetical protein